jgi:hypothetical protein
MEVFTRSIKVSSVHSDEELRGRTRLLRGLGREKAVIFLSMAARSTFKAA